MAALLNMCSNLDDNENQQCNYSILIKNIPGKNILFKKNAIQHLIKPQKVITNEKTWEINNTLKVFFFNKMI